MRILGPFEVRADGRVLDLGGRRPKTLLAVLALHAGEVVSAERLVDDLWGDEPPRSAHHLLHVYVSSLRKSVGSRLVTRSPGYVLETREDELDARLFERQVLEGRRQLAAGDPDAASAKLRDALDLWRGPALLDFAYEPFAQAEIARLGQLRLVAREERIEAELELGRHAELVGELLALVAEEPLREVPRGQLMLALYRCGRQTEALDAFLDARRVLADELGLEPGPPLQRLQQAILRHDPALGLRLGEAARRVDRPPASTRKLVTVLGASLAESPALAGLDPEPRSAVVARALDAVTEVIAHHGATVERSLGESVTGVFGVPVAHEDDALRAVRAATEARERLETVNDELERDWGLRLAGRFGIETGESVVDGASIAGEPLPRALRTSQGARAGEVLLGDSTYRLVRHAVVVESDAALGRLELWRLLTVLPDASTFARVESPLVGRHEELAKLRAAFARADERRVVELVTVIGEAGVGKSRLAQEFISSLGDGTTALVGRCLAYGEGRTFWPLRDVVRQAAGADTTGAVMTLLGPDAEREALAARIASAVGAGDLAGSRLETFRAFRVLFEAIARERPLLLVFEDVHWAETTFLDLVEYLTGSSCTSPTLVVCLARPEFRDARPGWPEQATIALGPLADDEAEALLGHLPGGAPLPDAARARLLATAEGNPLFLEQMLAMVGEADRFGDDVVFPPTIRAALAARLDRLGPSERAVLERAAIVGREFSLRAVVELLADDARPTASRHVKALVAKQLLRPAAAAAQEEDELRFHHVLIQEAAYRSIPKSRRAELHERLGDWLEREGRDRIAEVEEVVGFHLEQAYRFREALGEPGAADGSLAARAGSRLAAAGTRAFAREDLAAAANLLSRAASLLPPLHPTRVEVLPALGVALADRGELADAEEVLADAAASAEALGLSAVRMHALLVAAELDLASAEALARADRAASDAIALFTELGDDRGLARAWRLLSLVRFANGEGAAHRAALERALEHARRVGDEETEGECLSHICYSLSLEAVPVSEAAARAGEFLEWARGTGNPLREADAIGCLVSIRAMQDRIPEARDLVAAMRGILEEYGHRVGLVRTAWDAGTTELLADDPAAAERELRDGYETAVSIGIDPRTLPQLAEALYQLGRYDEADRLAALAIEQFADVGGQVLSRAVRAKALARRGRLEEAETLAREATSTGREIEFVEALGFALASLAEVLDTAGRHAEASEAAAEALRVYQDKGNVARARQVGQLLEELATRSSASADGSGAARARPRGGRASS